MAKMGVNPDTLDESLVTILLPVEHEEEVNGAMRKIPNRYIAEITKSREHTSTRSGGTSLKLTLAIDYQVTPEKIKRVYIDDFLPYSEGAAFRLAGLMKTLGIPTKDADTDNFIGRFVYVNIGHDELTLQDGSKKQTNKITRYVGIPSTEEIKAITQSTNQEDDGVSFP
jgi:hypothetical protein